jgi:hypothetical protein
MAKGNKNSTITHFLEIGLKSLPLDKRLGVALELCPVFHPPLLCLAYEDIAGVGVLTVPPLPPQLAEHNSRSFISSYTNLWVPFPLVLNRCSYCLDQVILSWKVAGPARGSSGPAG